MIFTFEEEPLRELYLTGKSANKKYCYQPDVDPRMIANNLTPSYQMHPGTLLKEEIEYRGLSQRKVAAQMGVSYSVLNEILNGKRPVTTRYALLFEAALDVPADMFIGLQMDYDKHTARKNKSFMKRLAQVRKIAASAAF